MNIIKLVFIKYITHQFKEMNTVDYAIPANYDTMLNTDNGSVPNVYINSDTDENQYDRID
jgi:hypothetical protein